MYTLYGLRRTACTIRKPNKQKKKGEKKMKNLLATLTEYKAMKAQLDALEAKIKEKRTEIEAYMTEKGTDKLTCGQYIATITECTKKSLDERMIREKYPEVAREAEKVTTYNRFTVK